MATKNRNFCQLGSLRIRGNSLVNQKRFSSATASSKETLNSNESQSSSDGNANSNKNSKSDERTEYYQKNWKRMKFTGIGLSAVSVAVSSAFIYTYGTPKVDDVGNVVIDDYSGYPFVKQIFARSWNELLLFVTSVSEPSRDKLLPEPLKEPYYQPKYTVVLEISGVLVHPDWTFNTGWRFKKRPAIDYFLKSLGYPRTELVVYTSEQGMTAQAIIESLDPENVIMYKLYRDTTKYQYKDGAHVKDLGRLNRDLSKVIFIDWDNKAFQLNPENALRIPKWNGDDEDLGLIDLANLIRTIVDSGVQDVRPILQHYSSCDDPVSAFREKQAQLEKERTQRVEHHDESLTKNYTGKLFGFGRHA